MAKANRTGLDRATGAVLTDWPHCVQSIQDILTTNLNTRVMRLDYGSGDHTLVDRPGNREVIATWYANAVAAILKWEPGYRVTQFTTDGAGNDGHYTFTLDGLFYPRGHLGDYSLVETQSLTLSVPTVAA